MKHLEIYIVIILREAKKSNLFTTLVNKEKFSSFSENVMWLNLKCTASTNV